MITPLLANTAGSSESYFDLGKAFQGCPIIYSLLIAMSIASLAIWLYTLLTLKLSDIMPSDFIAHIRRLLENKEYEVALRDCRESRNFTSGILASGLAARKHGPQVVMEAMQAEGRRAGNSLWQRISILNEIAVVAPMLGLLGTVLGLFFAFYDSNRTAESITSIFDGLGMAVGTTVVGLVVAILAMIFYTTLKFKVVNILNTVEYESLAIACLLEPERPHSPNNAD